MIRGLLSDDKFRFYDNTNYNGSIEDKRNVPIGQRKGVRLWIIRI